MTRKISTLNLTGKWKSSPTNPYSILFTLFLTILFFILVKVLITYSVLSGFSRLIIKLKIDHPDTISVYYTSRSTFQPKLFSTSEELPANYKGDVSINLKNNVVRKFRLDLGTTAGEIKCYGITLTSHYGKKIFLGPQQIFEQFEPNDFVRSFALQDDYLYIQTASGDPFLSYRGKSLQVQNYFLSAFLPVIFTTAFFFLISSIQISKFPPFTDLVTKTSSMNANIGALDGVRGFAALTVLGEHTGVLKGMGSLGVLLFFALSGFLLATPFVQQSEKAISYTYMSSFIARRVKRIIPMYYFFLTVTMVFRGKNPEMFRHFMFLQGDGHLWTLPQEMFFYMVLPFLVIAMHLLFRGRKLLTALALLILTLLTNHYLTIKVLSFYGYGTSLKSMAGVFMAGVMFSYLFHSVQEKTALYHHHQAARLKKWYSMGGLLLFCVLTLLSLRLIPQLHEFNPFQEPGIFGLLAGLLILLIGLADNTLLSKVSGFLPLRAVGLVSFSFYLLHPAVISVSRLVFQYYANFKLRGVSMFLISGILTYALATFTYTYIERPFLKQARSTAPRIIPSTDQS